MVIQNYELKKVLKELEKLESRKSLEFLSLSKHKNDERVRLVVGAFIHCPNKHYTGVLEGVKYP